MDKPTSVAAYFASLPEEARADLQKLRETIAAAVPEAEEGIAWSMPAFKLGGKALLGYAAFTDHYSLFPMSVAAIDTHRDALGEHVTGKGTISFEYGHRLPTTLVRKVVRTRVAEVAGKHR